MIRRFILSTNVIIFTTLILLVILLTKRKRKILHKIVSKRFWNPDKIKKESKQMKELAQRFIGKNCIIYTIDDSLIRLTGIIKEVGNTGMLIENKDGIQLVNLEFVSRICEYPRKRKDKKKISV